VHTLSEELSIPILTPESARESDFLSSIEELEPDLCITAAYGEYLPKRFLQAPKYGTLNIHPSLLPAYRGASPLQRSIQNGDEKIGVTVLFTVSKMDAGPIVEQIVEDSDPEVDAETYLDKYFVRGAELLGSGIINSVIDGSISMTQKVTTQDETMASKADKILKEEGELDFNSMTATECHNNVRAFAGWPGSTVRVNLVSGDNGNDVETVKLKVLKTRVVDKDDIDDDDLEKAHEREISPWKRGKKLSLVARCADGSMLEILDVQPPTKKPMDARSYFNGLRNCRIEWN